MSFDLSSFWMRLPKPQTLAIAYWAWQAWKGFLVAMVLGIFVCSLGITLNIENPKSNLLPSLFALTAASGLFIGFLRVGDRAQQNESLSWVLVQVVGAICALLAALFALDLESLNPCIVGGMSNYFAVYIAVALSIGVAVLTSGTAGISYSVSKLNPRDVAKPNDGADSPPIG